MMIPEIGDSYTWTPTAFCQSNDSQLAQKIRAEKRVSGRVVFVNFEHGWFRVEGTVPGGVIRECFHFV